jgi:hypothetical protein
MPGFVVDGAKIINNVETTKGMGRKKERVAFEWLETSFVNGRMGGFGGREICFGEWGDMVL